MLHSGEARKLKYARESTLSLTEITADAAESEAFAASAAPEPGSEAHVEAPAAAAPGASVLTGIAGIAGVAGVHR